MQIPIVQLITASAYHDPRNPRDAQRSAPERIVKRYWPKGVQHWEPGPVVGVPADVEGNPTGPELVATAEVNHNRWLVRCPFCDSGVQHACDIDRRFFCVDCLNLAAGGCWVRVVWPDDRTEIEEALLERPLGNRNWKPGQTAEDLRAEMAAATDSPDEEGDE